MNYPGGFGTLKAATFYTVVTLEGMLENNQMDADTTARLTELLAYVKGAMDRADSMVKTPVVESKPYYVSKDHGILYTKEQFDALMDDIDEDTSPCNYLNGKE